MNDIPLRVLSVEVNVHRINADFFLLKHSLKKLCLHVFIHVMMIVKSGRFAPKYDIGFLIKSRYAVCNKKSALDGRCSSVYPNKNCKSMF